MDRWQDIKQVVVVGLGITGLSVVRHLRKTQPQLQVKVIDTRLTPPGVEQLPPDIALHVGSWNEAWLAEADLVVTNPGIALATPQIQTVLARGVAVVGDIELFAWAADKPVIAITGSNGKSTVTDLTGVMANACGVKCAIGGNIGVPALDLLEQEVELYVLELSSFQLETTSSLHLVAAAFLNLSEDHMDRYQGMDDYRQAKLRIFQHAKHGIVNRDDRQTYPETSHDQQSLALVTFGSDDSEFGVMSHLGESWLSHNQQPILASRELKLVGQHNVANVLVVLALLTCAGIDYRKGLSALKSYTGLTHRCQVVADNRGIKWVNDSKATNLASTQAALSGLNCAGKLYLLVGGDGKGADFSPLKPILAQLNLQLCCFGADGDQFMPLHASATRFERMEDVIEHISPQLQSGDMVMLSPACASFDQFSNFMARGDRFAELARQYA
ncbi:UDP-N-acetylmuramoyl-L-alanine--D-glutamate ligase [Vibrio vulnificus]|uniref:UDP-N-acetylmuramoyl-L-alanine--D-glutamate ligase n=1 Tax=Vibrio vulnificus TaxID=672 RepID=UPI0005019357|nr:UDP-N-acetylmuramoyl-L-alanine--D-glutamate ligase [Vibrio vulnificus]ASJ39595.1 UDP-N-acetylmuramoylalanine--D-glutamate ligase [Vibrio vulnificus]EGQ8025859.1 UDP-N-acetylmuramoyl-L-alanine--D-glutamate ligase [Vibrio vulnificus]EGQ8085571.1 UDP-N-acetylmuramoyl-L-alanine--D-glutamate ligase [Vibrio vulnificus]EGR0350254.1 UDP-N-acetylmuramoyl-L-alanine--D-glutamate ligase [Vibrio vulnificus]EGR0638721.1 UDP-N-acetylmuramoyl-L-alanine--D-glutamate ligase [Vibrio vulnificus]